MSEPLADDELVDIEAEHERMCIACNHTNAGTCTQSLLLAEVRQLRAGIATQRDAALAEPGACGECGDEDYPAWLTATWALIGDDDV